MEQRESAEYDCLSPQEIRDSHLHLYRRVTNRSGFTAIGIFLFLERDSMSERLRK